MSRQADIRPRSMFPARVLLPLSGLILLAGIASGGPTAGAYGILASSSTTTATFRDAGAPALAFTDATTGGHLALAIESLLPGTSQQVLADLKNIGTDNLATLQLTIAGTGTGTNSDGLQLAIDRCSTAWIASTTSRYTCPGTLASISADRPLEATIDILESPAEIAGGVDHLRLTFRLPITAPNTGQGTFGSALLTMTGTV